MESFEHTRRPAPSPRLWSVATMASLRLLLACSVVTYVLLSRSGACSCPRPGSPENLKALLLTVVPVVPNGEANSVEIWVDLPPSRSNEPGFLSSLTNNGTIPLA